MNSIIIKGIGAVILIISSLWYGLTMISEEKRKIDEARAISDFIKYIRDNIEHFIKPLPDIFVSYRNNILEKNGFLGGIRTEGIRKSADKLEEFFSTDGDILVHFREFCLSIGDGYKENEIRLCTYTTEQIEKRLENLKADYTAKSKLYRTIPPLFALSVVLILV